MLISDEYRSLNAELHSRNPDYGTSGRKYAETVMGLSVALQTKDILDYGCGKRTLEQALGFGIANYDPAIAGLDEHPRPAHIVACTDVLEHIEPECLATLLLDLRRVTLKACFAVIATRPAKKTLADGRNAHLIQNGQAWWLPKLWEAGFTIKQMLATDGEIQLVLM